MKHINFIRFALIVVVLVLIATGSAVAHPDDVYWDSAFGATGADSRVHAFYIDGNDLYVGGYFNNIGGIEACGIARWDGQDWHAMGVGLGSERYDGVSEILVHDGVV
ncbi:MAG: hypothetical protein KAT30_08135, partial [Candidatus Krumholzibacteria bacterium]|nr:hypothetical protein [Candidatus Krumholzibacteria bacterium]